MKQKLVIIWWTGDFWSWLAIFLKENFSNNLDIFITWRDEKSSKETSLKIWVWYFKDNFEAVKNSDIIIFSVPINKTLETIKELGPHIKPGSIVLDLTSIKSWPSDYMNKYISKDCLIIPTHPMFWPNLKSISGQIIVLTPESNILKNQKYIYIKNILENLWAKVIETSSEEHDQMMAVVQWLTHYSMFVIWKTIKSYWIDIWKTFDFVSPIYKLMISSVSRYVWQSPYLYADIQMNNDEILKIHDLFTDSSKEFNDIVKRKDREEFVSMIFKTKEFFWEDNCKMWQSYTDKVIYLLWLQSKKLHENIWKEISLENIYTKETKKWILKSFDDHEIILWTEILLINEWIIL